MISSRARWVLGILLLTCLPRLAQIDARPIGHHGWRQADTAAVARNFHQGGYRLLYPQVDWETPGYVEMELPLYPWAVALGYGLIGERIWVARGMALGAALATAVLLFLLAERHGGREQAGWAALVWAVLPLSVFFGRAVMPESWMIAASVAGVYAFTRWCDDGGWRPLLAAAILVALAGLLKPTSLHLGLPLLWLARNRIRTTPRARRQLAAFAGLVLGPILAWYWHAHRLGASTGATFGIFSGPAAKVGRWDILLQPDFYHRVFLGFVADRLLIWAGFALLLLALFLPRRSRRERLFDWWLAAAALMLLIGCGGSYFHEYYALPLLPPAAAHIGRALAWIRARSTPALALALLLLGALSLWRGAGYFAVERAARPADPGVAQDLLVADLLSRHTGASDRILSCDQTDPTWLYLSRRKGWGRACEAMDKRAVVALRERGARFLVARHVDLERGPAGGLLRRHLLAFYRVLHDDGEVLLVDLAPIAPSRLFRRPLWSDDFADAAPPSGWRLESGRWEERDGWLRLEPTRRRLAAVFESAPECAVCALEATLAIEPNAAADRRAVVTLSGWREGESSTDAVFDVSSGRLTLVRTHQGAAAAAAVVLPRLGDGPHRVTLSFDLFDFSVHLDSRLLVSLPAPRPGRAHGGFAVAARNAAVRLDELRILAPGGEPSPGPGRGDDAATLAAREAWR